MQGRAQTALIHALSAARRALTLGDLPAAAAACAEAMALDPNDSAGFAMLALVSMEQDALDTATEAAIAALALRPEEPMLLNLSAAIDIRRGLWDEALAFSDRVLAINPDDVRALADRGFLLTKLGRAEEASHLLDFAHLVRRQPIVAPSGFDDIARFNTEVARAILEHASLAHQGRGKTLVEAYRLPDIFDLEPCLVRPLTDIFLNAERDWLAAVGPPITRSGYRRPRRSRLVAWANVVPSLGYERAHIHESAWLSGVYYVEMPEIGGRDAASLVFGGHDADDLAPMLDNRLAVMPEAGQIIVFPSHLYHRTLPTAAPGRRISIAFDLVPT